MDDPTDDWLEESGVDYLSLVVDRSQVESGDLSEPLSALQGLLGSRARVLQFANRVQIAFHGYDADSRELYTIPEVRRFVRRLDAEFPYWLWFLDCASYSPSLIATCLVDVEAVSVPGDTAYIKVPTGALGLLLASRFNAVSAMSARYNLDAIAITELGDRVALHFGLPSPRSDAGA